MPPRSERERQASGSSAQLHSGSGQSNLVTRRSAPPRSLLASFGNCAGRWQPSHFALRHNSHFGHLHLAIIRRVRRAGTSGAGARGAVAWAAVPAAAAVAAAAAGVAAGGGRGYVPCESQRRRLPTNRLPTARPQANGRSQCTPHAPASSAHMRRLRSLPPSPRHHLTKTSTLVPNPVN